ncbi:trans-2-enoyl-CoA reductase [Infundibulicybe gibba]|nr:trans-2-enoyl-CoA reductase [Infundibulicybe gibba]
MFFPSSTYRPLVSFRVGARYFASTRQRADRAIVYTQNGDPSKVLTAFTYPPLPAPGPSTVNIKFLLSPINPADVNVVEGVYPSKPNLNDSLAASGKGSVEEPVYVGGNEGLGQVIAVGSGVSGLQKGDWVVMTRQQAGTWSTSKNVNATDVIKVPKRAGLTEVHAATMTVNPPTAYNMLSDFVPLQVGDWVVQNGANSAVGQAVIQIAASRGLKTLNFVRNRENLSGLVQHLEDLGATRVLTYDDLSDKSLRDKIKEWIGGKSIKLGLNCVGKASSIRTCDFTHLPRCLGGRETSLMMRLLSRDGHLVSYGAMSKQPLSFPTSLFIFKNLTAHGFWQSQWYMDRTSAEKEALFEKLVGLMSEGKNRHMKNHDRAEESDEDASRRVRDVMAKLSEGQLGRKILLKLES